MSGAAESFSNFLISCFEPRKIWTFAVSGFGGTCGGGIMTSLDASFENDLEAAILDNAAPYARDLGERLKQTAEICALSSFRER